MNLKKLLKSPLGKKALKLVVKAIPYAPIAAEAYRVIKKKSKQADY